MTAADQCCTTPHIQGGDHAAKPACRGRSIFCQPAVSRRGKDAASSSRVWHSASCLTPHASHLTPLPSGPWLLAYGGCYEGGGGLSRRLSCTKVHMRTLERACTHAHTNKQTNERCIRRRLKATSPSSEKTRPNEDRVRQEKMPSPNNGGVEGPQIARLRS